MTTIRRSGLSRKSNYYAHAKDSDCTKPETMELLSPTFNKSKSGTTPDDFRRPAFHTGLDCSNKGKNIDISSKRSGLGNNLIIRPSFATPSVEPSRVVDYLLQAKIEQQQQGMKVTLGDSTLKKLFEIATGDPDDVLWIAEYNRRKALGETDKDLTINPPLGRPQRVLMKTVNFAEASNLATISSLSITEQLKTIAASVTTSASSTEVKDALAKIFAILENSETLSEENNKIITQILNASKSIPTKAKLWLGVDSPRYLSFRQYSGNTGLVKAYLQQKPLEAPDKLVFGKSGNPVALASAIVDLRKEREGYGPQGLLPFKVNNFYLDVETKMIVRRDIVVFQVNRGVDNGQIDGQDPPVDSTGKKYWLSAGEEQALLAKELAAPSGTPLGTETLLDVD